MRAYVDSRIIQESRMKSYESDMPRKSLAGDGLKDSSENRPKDSDVIERASALADQLDSITWLAPLSAAQANHAYRWLSAQLRAIVENQGAASKTPDIPIVPSKSCPRCGMDDVHYIVDGRCSECRLAEQEADWMDEDESGSPWGR